MSRTPAEMSAPAAGATDAAAPAPHGSATLHAAILDALPSPVAVLDAAGIIIAVNAAWRHAGDAGGMCLPGHGVGTDYLRTCAAAPDEPTAADAERGIRQVLSGGADAFELEYPCHSPEQQRWFLLRVAPLRDMPAGGAVVMHIDITERVQAAQDLERLSREATQREHMLGTMLSASADLTYAIDRRGRLLYANQASLNVWGISLEQAEGMDSRNLGYPPALSRRIDEQVGEVFRAARPVRDETPFTLRDGTEAHFEYVFAPAFGADGGVDFVVGCSRNITGRKRAEEALRRSEAKFRTLASAMPQIVWASDADCEFTYLNELWSAYTGRGISESLGHGWLAAVHPADRAPVLDACRTSYGTGEPSSVEVRLARADGQYRWWLFRGVAVEDEAGQVNRCIGTWTDIDELKAAAAEVSRANRELQLQRNELRTLLDLVPAGLWFKDTEGRIVQLNERAARAMGVSVAEGIGMKVADRFPAQAERYGQEDEDLVRSGRPLLGQVEHLRDANGKEAWFQSDKVPYRDENGNVVGIIVMKQDITERKMVQDALHELNLHLEARVRERTAELTIAQEEAERANRAKSTFLATMSHEIRTPMAGLLGLLELLEFTPLDDGQRSTLQVARESGDALKRLIDGVLDFSKIESDTLDLDVKPSSLRAVVEGVCALHAPVAARKDVELALSVDPAIASHLMFDALRLGQILNNFVGNAIKFTESGRVAIDVALLERSGGRQHLRLAVSDTGIGIAADRIDQLFRAFVQADAQIGTHYGGTGLGLFISRRLAERMGARVALDSTLGQGTTATLWIALDECAPGVEPVRTSQAERLQLLSLAHAYPAPPSVQEAEASGTLLLVVDDHPINRMLLLRQVSTLGYAAEAAADGADGLQAWSSGRFAAVITDCNMPRMDGLELTRAIRAREAGGARRTPIIGCTANVLADVVRACTEAGMDALVTKPVTLQEIYTELAAWVPLPHMAGRAALQEVAPAAAGAGTAPLDMSLLHLIAGDDAAAMDEVVRDFRRCNDDDAAGLRAAVRGHDAAAARHFAHRIAGACATMGAAPLAEAASRVQGAVSGRLAVPLQEAMDDFDREYARLNAFLASPG